MDVPHIILISHGFQSHYELGVANGLAQNNLRVTLLGSDTTLRAKLHSSVEFINIRGSQSSSRSFWKKSLNLLQYHFRLARYVLANRNATVMVIGLVSPELLVGILEGLFLRAFSSRYMLTVHNILPHDKHTVWMKSIYWLIYRLPNLLVVHTSNTTADLVNKFGIIKNKVVVMEHGSNDAVELSHLKPDQAREILGFDANDIVLMFFGAVAPYKGLDILLDALVDHTQVKLLVAGRCPNSEYGNEIRKRISDLVSEGQAVWKEGFLSESEISTVFAASSAVVLPYRHIDQSGVLLLSLSLGIPMISTNVGSFGAMITSEIGLVIDEANSVELSRGITKFLENKKIFNAVEISNKGKAFAWQNTVKSILTVVSNKPS